MALLLAVITFGAVVLMVGAVLFATRGTSQAEVVGRRLHATANAPGGKSVLDGASLVRDEKLSSVPILNRFLLRWPGAERLRAFLEQAGLKLKPGKLILLSAVLALLTYLLALEQHYSVFVSAILGFAAAAVPFGFVAIKRQRRLRRFERDFPEAIDLLGRAIRAGHALTAGLEMIHKEMPDPVAGEFRIVFEEHSFGLPLRDALLNLAARIPLLDVRFFITGLLVQKETGGNLAELLDNLSAVVRERFKIRGDVRVRTAQGRFTAALLLALPPLMLLFLRSANPNYVNVLFEDPWGPWILGGAALLQLVGSAIIWKIVHIEV
ncbi:MAG: type II secretion system F family protein [Acidobacteria bacterium]|nr:type II secretion system F family protein [Acidobacteriota bacterium]